MTSFSEIYRQGDQILISSFRFPRLVHRGSKGRKQGWGFWESAGCLSHQLGYLGERYELPAHRLWAHMAIILIVSLYIQINAVDIKLGGPTKR